MIVRRNAGSGQVLQVNNRTPLRLLAEKVDLSTAAAQRCIRRMAVEGVIVQNAAVVNPDRIGKVITLLADVQVQ